MRTTILACVFLGLAIVAAAARAADAPRTDAHGDPLPNGTLARLGTIRWRADSAIVMTGFLPDGKAVLTISHDYLAQVWDRDTGKELRRFDAAGPAATDPYAPRTISLSPYSNPVILGADGKSLVCAGRDGAVRLWDVATGREVRKLADTSPGSLTPLALTADGKMLAVAVYGQKIRLWDVAGGKELRSFGPGATAKMRTYKMIFSAGGKTLVQAGMDVGSGGAMSAVVVWDAVNGKEIQRIIDLEDSPSGTAALYSAIAPDANLLAFPVAGKVKLIDLTTGKETRRLDGWDGYTLVFSPDGKFLVALGGRREVLTVWEVATGKAVRQFGKAEAPAALFPVMAGSRRPAFALSVSPDGNLLAWGEGPVVRLVDLETGREKNALAGHTATPRHVSFSADGRTVLTWGDDATIRRWDAATGKGISRTTVSDLSHRFFVPSPDERTIAAGDADGNIHLFDAATGQEKRVLKPDQPTSGQTVAFAPDSRLLAVVSTAAQAVQLYDVATGKEKHALPLPTTRRARGGLVAPGARPARHVIFSSDGRLVAATDGNVVLWDVATGREVRQIGQPREGTIVRDAVFSPDGRTVAVDTNVAEIGIWEVASGQKRHTVNPLKVDPAQATWAYMTVAAWGANATTLAFSPDGRLLAQTDDRKARLWDLRAGKEVGVFDGHRSLVYALAFAPDGKRLATVSTDTTGLVWDAEPARKKLDPLAAALPKEQLEPLWADLADGDAARAYRAVGALAGDPAKAVPFLGERLKPAVAPDAWQVARLIDNLDAEAFQVRESARKELEKLGELALSGVREALKGRPSAEQRRALEELVSGVAVQTFSGERLRLLRALEALELAATPDAVRVLKRLAGGAPDALPTTQAQAVLTRLGQHQVVSEGR